MKAAVEEGFTVYVSKKDDRLVSTALRSLGIGCGIQPIYMEEENLKAVDGFSFLHLLEEGKILQLYKGNYGGKIYPYYIAQLGTMCGEGAYGENECFFIEAEGVASDFYDALMSLEGQCVSLEEGASKTPIKTAYRLYGSPRYETAKR